MDVVVSTMCMCECLVAQLCSTLCDPIDCSLTGSSGHGYCASKNTGVGCHALLQGIFLTQGLNLHCRFVESHALQANSLQSEPPGKLQ